MRESVSALESVTWPGRTPDSAGVLDGRIGAAHERRLQEVVLVESPVEAAGAEDDVRQEGRPLQRQDAPEVAVAAGLRPALARLPALLHNARLQARLAPRPNGHLLSSPSLSPRSKQCTFNGR